MLTKLFQTTGTGLPKVLFPTSETNKLVVTATPGPPSVQLSLHLLSLTMVPAQLVPTPETTSLFNNQLHALAPSVTTVAMVDGITGFGSTCKLLQLFKPPSILSHQETE